MSALLRRMAAEAMTMVDLGAVLRRPLRAVVERGQ